MDVKTTEWEIDKEQDIYAVPKYFSHILLITKRKMVTLQLRNPEPL